MQDDSVLAKILVDAHGPELKVGEPIALAVEDQEAYERFLQLDPTAYQHLVAPSAAAPPAVQTNEVASSSSTTAAATNSESAKSPSSAQKEQRMSPAARHMAQSRALDTSAVVGTARGGLISKSDLVLAIQSGVATVDPAKLAQLKSALDKPYTPHTAPPAAATDAAPANGASAAAIPASSSSLGAAATASVAQFTAPAPQVLDLDISREPVNGRYTDVPNSNMRKVIAKRLTESKQTVPHFYSSMECEIDALMDLRSRLKRDFSVSTSVNDFVIKVGGANQVLKRVPSPSPFPTHPKHFNHGIHASLCMDADHRPMIAPIHHSSATIPPHPFWAGYSILFYSILSSPLLVLLPFGCNYCNLSAGRRAGTERRA